MLDIEKQKAAGFQRRKLPQQIRKILTQAGVITDDYTPADQICRFPSIELLRMPGFSNGSLQLISEAMSMFGRELGDMVDPNNPARVDLRAWG